MCCHFLLLVTFNKLLELHRLTSGREILKHQLKHYIQLVIYYSLADIFAVGSFNTLYCHTILERIQLQNFYINCVPHLNFSGSCFGKFFALSPSRHLLTKQLIESWNFGDIVKHLNSS